MSALLIAAAPKLIQDICAEVIVKISDQPSIGLTLQDSQALGESLGLMLKCRSTIERRFVHSLQLKISAPVTPLSAARTTAPIRFQTLELLDDQQVQHTVDSARHLQALNSAVDGVRPALDALVANLQGHASVFPGLNPVRPDVFLEALDLAFADTPASALVRRIWVKHAGPALGRELKTQYQTALEFLQSKGITPVGFVVRKSLTDTVKSGAARGLPVGQLSQNQGRAGGFDGDKTGVFRVPQFGTSTEPEAWRSFDDLPPNAAGGSVNRALAASASPAGPGMVGAAGAVQASDATLTTPATGAQHALTVDRLRQVLGAAGAQQSGFNVSSAPMSVEAMFDAPLASHANERAILGILSNAAAAELAPAENEPGVDAAMMAQVAGEALKVMIESMAGDERLLEPVRKTVLRLEPSLAALVQHDLSFFGDENHPARQLLDEICQRSLAHTDVDSDEFVAFFAPIHPLLRSIEAHAAMSAQVFADALDAALVVWSEQDAHRERQAQAAVEALLRAERRDEFANQVASQVFGMPESAGAQQAVLSFLTGPWARVIAQVEFESVLTSTDSQRYRGVIADLLWSTKIEEAGKNRNRLVRLVPPMVAALKAGLKTIEYSEEEQQAFFGQLMDWHAMVLRPGGVPSAPVANPHSVSVREHAGERPATAWVAQEEVRHSGFLPSPHASAEIGGASATVDDVSQDDAQPSGLQRADMLTVGMWVDLKMQGDWVRSRLTWMSPLGKLFMFTGPTGASHSMSRRSLDKMFLTKGVRLVAQRKVTERALDAVADRALSNSLENGAST